MKTVLKIQVFLLLFCLTDTVHAQGMLNDSIELTNYSSIREAYYQAFDKNQFKRANYFATIYLQKAKREDKNTIEHIHGHYFKYEVSEFDVAQLHLDSIIGISKYIKNDPKYPEYAYFLKAGAYYDKEDLKKSLDNYLIAMEVAESKNNQYMIALCKTSIGLLKAERIGQEQDALNLLKQSLQFYDAIEDKFEYDEDYAKLLFALSENYRRLDQLDSSSYYNTRGLAFSKEYNVTYMQPYFIYAEGINMFFMGFPKSAIDKLENSLPSLNLSNSIIAHYYLSKSYEELENFDKKLMHLSLLDSLQEDQPIYLLELRKGIEELFQYYKEQGDLEKQLQYTLRLTLLDSIKFNDYTALAPTIDSKYDDKQILNENEALMESLLSSGSSKQKLLYIILFLLVIIVSIFYYFHNRQQKIKKQFQVIIANEESKKEQVVVHKKDIDIPQETIDTVLEKLNAFELEEGYRNHEIDTYKLSKIIGINDKYLSKIINHTKEKSFTHYINDLRVAYAMQKLRTDPDFKNRYTISGIAKEVGFLNPKPFNKSFKRVYKISPKDFISELKK